MEILKPKFVQMDIQEKGNGDNDFRAFLYCDYLDERFEIRGYGSTLVQAADEAYRRFTDEDWYLYCSDIYPIPID